MPLFESPVGTQHERNAGIVWGSAWTDRFNKFGDRYEIRTGSGVWSRHTGVDLNLIRGEDENAQIYSIGDGFVTYADVYPDSKTWGGLIIIYHHVIDNRPVYSRYAHVQGIEPSIFKKKLVEVTKGQPIARIGGRELGFDPHLHFDISVTDVLDGDHRAAGYWPGDNLDLVQRHFVDPLDWLRNHQQMTAAAIPDPTRIARECRVIHPDGTQVQKDHSLNAEFVKKLEKDSTVVIKKKGVAQDGFLWGQVSGGSLNDFWVRLKDENSGVAYIEKIG
jgi:peptidase M23-like protein